MAKAIKTAIIAAAVTYLTIITAGAILGSAAFAGTAVGAYGATLTAGFAFTSAVVTGIGTLIASGIGMLSSRGINASAENFGTKLAGLGGQNPRQIIYGECRVGGTIVNMATSGTENNKLHLAIALAGHEIESLERVYINDEALTVTSSTISGQTVYTVTNVNFTNTENTNNFGSGRLIRYSFNDGSQTAVDPFANANLPGFFPTTAKYQGIAYVYMELIYDAEKVNKFPALWFHVKGKKVYDPRTATTAYSNNSALCIRDFLTDTLYGLKATSGEINDGSSAVLGNFWNAADICDELVFLTASPSSTEPRYTANGFTSASATLDGVLEALLSSCAGHITYTNGQFNIYVGGDQTPALNITDDDILSPVSIETKAKGGELYNTVKSVFVDKAVRYQATEAPVYENSTYLAEDTPSGESSANYKKTLELQFPFTTSHTAAQRLQTIVLRRQRKQVTLSMLTSLNYMKTQPGDWVTVTNSRLGYTNKTFEVQAQTMEFLEAEGVVAAATRLQLMEIDDTIYDYDAGDYLTPQPEGTDRQLGGRGISPPSGLTLTQSTLQEGTTAKIVVKAAWTNAPDEAIQNTELQVRLGTETDSDFRTVATAGPGVEKLETKDVVVGQTYHVRIRHISGGGIRSTWTSTSTITIAEPDSIGPPTSVSASTGSIGSISIEFTAPTQASVTNIRIYYSTTSGFTPGSGNLLTSIAVGFGEKRRHAVGRADGLAYGTTYYFKLTAVNSYGTESSATAEVSGIFSKVGGTDIEDAALTTAKFASGIEPVSLVTSVPSTLVTQTIYNTSDNTLYRWNGSSYVSAVGATSFAGLSGTITSTQIGTNTIQSGNISANAIAAYHIAGGTITAAEIASNTITAGEIAAGAIGTSELSANAVTVDKLSSSSDTIATGLTFGLANGATINGYTAVGVFKSTTSSGVPIVAVDDGGSSFAVVAGVTSTSSSAYAVIAYAGVTPSGSNYSGPDTIGALGSGNKGGYFLYTGASTSTTVSTSSRSILAQGVVEASSFTPFTGSHICLASNSEAIEAGDIVVDVDVVASKGVSDTITKITKCAADNQKGAIGVYREADIDQMPAILCDFTEVIEDSGIPDITKALKPEFSTIMDDYTAVHVNSVGEGLINVCGQNGDIELGDLISCSSVAGKGMKQADDLVHSYTVAKARESITFADPSEIAQISCVYLCG